MSQLMPPHPEMQRAGAKVPIDEYVRRLWQRRWFVLTYSTASNSAGFEGKFLGQAWQLLTPLLNICVYYLIFGFLFHTNRGIPNFIAFLAVGVFVFAICTQSLTAGSHAIIDHLGLVRAFQFPKAVLPIATTLMALMRFGYSLIVIIPILILSGQPVALRWLELVPAIGLQAMFCLGLALTTARIGSRIPDLPQLLQFVTRVWMYLSGVMYSVQRLQQIRLGWLSAALGYNPGSIFLLLARHALLTGMPVTPKVWLLATVWAFGLLTTSFVTFWRHEEEYGNV